MNKIKKPLTAIKKGDLVTLIDGKTHQEICTGIVETKLVSWDDTLVCLKGLPIKRCLPTDYCYVHTEEMETSSEYPNTVKEIKFGDIVSIPRGHTNTNHHRNLKIIGIEKIAGSLNKVRLHLDRGGVIELFRENPCKIEVTAYPLVIKHFQNGELVEFYRQLVHLNDTFERMEVLEYLEEVAQTYDGDSAGIFAIYEAKEKSIRAIAAKSLKGHFPYELLPPGDLEDQPKVPIDDTSILPVKVLVQLHNNVEEVLFVSPGAGIFSCLLEHQEALLKPIEEYLDRETVVFEEDEYLLYPITINGLRYTFQIKRRQPEWSYACV